MDIYEKFRGDLTDDWTTQGFNAMPVFLTTAGRSGIVMKNFLGFGYSKFIFHYDNGYGEMFYLKNDFSRIWHIVKAKLEKDKSYLLKTKQEYNKIFSSHKNFFKYLDSLKLNFIDNESLLVLLKKCSVVQNDAVGIAHVIDAIGIEIESDFKVKLSKYIEDKSKFNNYFSILVTPTQPSFIAQEEESLRRISRLKGEARLKRMKQHLTKFFWTQNSFAGAQTITIKTLEKRINSLPLRLPDTKVKLVKVKESLIKKLHLNEDVRQMIKVIDFVTNWQDERKANGMKTIYYFSRILDEISIRLKWSNNLLNYLAPSDIDGLSNLVDIKRIKNTLKQRQKGVFMVLATAGEYQIQGDSYKRLIAWYKSSVKAMELGDKNELHGTVANMGTAIGRVVVCKGLNSLNKVKRSDVMVTSMTRPEFLPALRKVAAIITDEGGITSHAAIIARELNIPAVIGTKIATQVLKDGDLVEVRANHGLIRILRK